MVELLGGLFALSTYLKFGLTIEALIYYLFFAALIVVTFIDLDHRIIPDVITLPGIPICFAAGFALPTDRLRVGFLVEWQQRDGLSAEQRTRWRVVTAPHNRGKGAAVRAGVCAAQRFVPWITAVSVILNPGLFLHQKNR